MNMQGNEYVLFPEKSGRDASTFETSDCLRVVSWRTRRSAKRMTEAGRQQMPHLHLQQRLLPSQGRKGKGRKYDASVPKIAAVSITVFLGNTGA